MTANSPVHVLALLKGAVEGDPYKHFASLLGIAQHLEAAAALGLMTPDGRVTAAGAALYEAAGLHSLPEGRANHWWQEADSAIEILDARARRRSDLRRDDGGIEPPTEV
jgi:hypothetical protein